MKKRMALLLASVMALSLTACGQKTEAPAQTEEPTGTEAAGEEETADAATEETAAEGG